MANGIQTDGDSNAHIFLARWVPSGEAGSVSRLSFLTHKRNNKICPWEEKCDNKMVVQRLSPRRTTPHLWILSAPSRDSRLGCFFQ